jgi:hypothetical protein
MKNLYTNLPHKLKIQKHKIKLSLPLGRVYVNKKYCVSQTYLLKRQRLEYYKLKYLIRVFLKKKKRLLLKGRRYIKFWKNKNERLHTRLFLTKYWRFNLLFSPWRRKWNWRAFHMKLFISNQIIKEKFVKRAFIKYLKLRIKNRWRLRKRLILTRYGKKTRVFPLKKRNKALFYWFLRRTKNNYFVSIADSKFEIKMWDKSYKKEVFEGKKSVGKIALEQLLIRSWGWFRRFAKEIFLLKARRKFRRKLFRYRKYFRIYVVFIWQSNIRAFKRLLRNFVLKHFKKTRYLRLLGTIITRAVPFNGCDKKVKRRRKNRRNRFKWLLNKKPLRGNRRLTKLKKKIYRNEFFKKTNYPFIMSKKNRKRKVRYFNKKVKKKRVLSILKPNHSSPKKVIKKPNHSSPKKVIKKPNHSSPKKVI